MRSPVLIDAPEVIDLGEAKRKLSATQQFIAKHPDCCFCSGIRRAVTRDHMPPKALFDNSHRPDKLIMPACNECNNGTSTSDLIAAIASRWNYNSDEQSNADHAKLVVRIRNHHPEFIREWTEFDTAQKIQALAHLKSHGVPVPNDAGTVSIGVNTIKHLNLFAHKATLALHYEHFGKPVPKTGGVSAYWRTKEDFAKEGIPKALLEMMKQYGTLEQGKWNTSKIFEYRYEYNKTDGLFMCLTRLRGNLFTTGFTVTNLKTLKDEEEKLDWLRPSDLLKIPEDPRFEKRK